MRSQVLDRGYAYLVELRKAAVQLLRIYLPRTRVDTSYR